MMPVVMPVVVVVVVVVVMMVVMVVIDGKLGDSHRLFVCRNIGQRPLVFGS